MPPIRIIFSRRWVWLAVLVAAVLLGANFWLSAKLKAGLRDIAAGSGLGQAGSKEFAKVGPATAEAVRKISSQSYSITVFPFDWLGESLAVTHTAFLESAAGKIGVRVRFDPFSGKFLIVGFYTVH
jgi:hypothetical protein